MKRAAATLLGVIFVASCGPGSSEAPIDGEAVRNRVQQTQTAQHRTGAEAQDRAQNRTVRTVYLCGDNERLSVDFDNPRRMATVRNSRGEAVDLYQEQATEGIWYRASGHELRGRGISATWTATGRSPTECRAID